MLFCFLTSLIRHTFSSRLSYCKVATILIFLTGRVNASTNVIYYSTENPLSGLLIYFLRPAVHGNEEHGS